MPEYLSPGVYVEEIDSGSKPIEGVSTSTAGMVGVTERGPANWPMLVTSYGEYTRLFGEFLPASTFSNSNGSHNFLPHAVEGFFTNGGKRLYVTRVLDANGATSADFELHDRGLDTSTFTLLLRNAPEGSGTLASGNPLYVVSLASLIPGGTGLAAGEHIRLDDGSPSEYHQVDQVAVAPFAGTHVILDFPLARSHTVPTLGQVEHLVRTALAGINPVNLTADAARADTAVSLTGGAPDVAAVVVGSLLEFSGGGEVAEYRVVRSVSAISGTSARVTLDAPLSMAHPAASTTVTLLDISTVNTPTVLDRTANAGDRAVFLTTVSAYVTDSLLVFDRTDPSVEVRRAGSLGAFQIAGATFETYPAGSLVEVVRLADDRRIITVILPPGLTSAVTVNDPSQLFTGMQLQVDVGANMEVMTIQSVVGTTVTFNALFANPHVAPLPAVPIPVQLGAEDRRNITAVAATGPLARVTVDDANRLFSGMMLQLDTGANMETLTILSVAGTTITFTGAFVNPHVTPFPAVPVPMRLTADAAGGSSVIAVDNRQMLQVDDVLEIGDPPNEEYCVVAALPNFSIIPPNDGIVVLQSPLARAHSGRTPTSPGENVRVPKAPILDSSKPPSVLEFDVNANVSLVITSHGNAVPATSSNYALGDHVRITTPSGSYYHRISSTPAALAPDPVTILNPALSGRHGAGSVIWQRNPLVDVQALDPGVWGDRLRISVQDEPQGLVSRTRLSFVNAPLQIRLASPAGVESGTILELLDSAGNPIGSPLKVDSVNRTANYLISLATPGLQPVQLAAIAASLTPLPVRSREFSLTAMLLHQPDTARPQRNEIVIASEVFRSLSMDPRHSHYIQKVIGDINGPLRLDDHRPEGQSDYVRVHDLAQDLLEPARTAALNGIRLGPETLIDILPSGRPRAARHPLSGGDDSVGSMDDAIYIGADSAQPENRTGLYTLQNVDDISIVGCPGRTSPAMQGALIDHCELMRYRFAVLDGPQPPGDSLNDVQFQRQQFDTKYAALYYPWILIPDPFPANPDDVADFPIPPSGHLQGIYARTDIDRGVHKAPANEVVSGILGLQRIVNQGEQDILNPYPVNINVIRDFRPNNRGIRVWGARVITSDSDFKYVNVRRLLIFIEKSIDLGLQWVVFEPNAEPLWARVVRSIGNFLTVVWRNGALEGVKREEAFFVKCDRTTMTQTDIDSGRLIVIVGVAPVKPAEFVIVRIGLWTAHSDD